MSDARVGSIKAPVIVERDNLLALVNQNAALHLKVGEMYEREARMLTMLGDLLTAMGPLAVPCDVNTFQAASVIQGVRRELEEMRR